MGRGCGTVGSVVTSHTKIRSLNPTKKFFVDNQLYRKDRDVGTVHLHLSMVLAQGLSGKPQIREVFGSNPAGNLAFFVLPLMMQH